MPEKQRKSPGGSPSSDINLEWTCNTPGLIEEIGNCCTEAPALVTPLRILQSMLQELAEVAIRIDDPELNVMMLRLSLYDVPHMKIDAAIKRQRKRMKTKEVHGNG